MLHCGYDAAVADNPKPPVAIRIVRPFASEEEFLENELETVGKASVILIGAHSRPQGVILRFEVVLANGTTLLRGEGRVLSHKENAFRGQAGLSLRFTRLDPRSKALVDRAVAMREAKASGGMIPVAAPVSVPEPEPPPPPPPAPVSEPKLEKAERSEKRRSFLPPRENALAQALSEDTPSPAPTKTRSQRPSERQQSRPAPPLPSTHSTPPPAPADEPPSAPEAIPQVDVPHVDAAIEREPSTTQRPTAPPVDDVATRLPNILQLTPPPAPVMRAIEDEPTHVETRSDRPPPPINTLVAPPSAMTAPPPINAPRPPARAVEKPAERDATLARLRERAGSMDESKRNAILDARRR